MASFGSCGQVGPVRAAGFDFAEETVGSLLPAEGEEKFQAVRGKLTAESIKVEAFNCLLPGDMKVTGDEVDARRIDAYLGVGLRRAAGVGARLVVFGSGGARRVPEGFPPQRAWRQLLDFLAVAAKHAAAGGITLAIEHLCRRETNIINTLRDGCRLARELGHPAVKVLLDSYHLTEEKEPLAEIKKTTGLLAHVHIADEGRIFPGGGKYDFRALFRAVKEAGYNGRVSMECDWRGDFAGHAPGALAYIRRQWQES